jgi:hypothetical protein
MNSQELRALQEAYSQVYELDEASVTDDRVRRNQKAFGSNYTPPRDWDQSANRGKGAVVNAKQKEKQRRKGLAKSAMGEAVDLYDIILSHLLDEGYADTQEAAEAIMSNMSEEWRESIMEAQGEWFGRLKDAARSRDTSVQKMTQPTQKPLPTTVSPFSSPNRTSSGDSGKLTTYGAGGGKAAEASGKSYNQVVKQGTANLENKKNTQPKNQGPDFGR